LATACSHTAYVKVEGIRGKVLHYNGIKILLGFFLNAHHNCLYNGFTQLQNQQYDHGLQRISLTCHFLAPQVTPRPVWQSGKNCWNTSRPVGPSTGIMMLNYKPKSNTKTLTGTIKPLDRPTKFRHQKLQTCGWSEKLPYQQGHEYGTTLMFSKASDS